MWKTSILTHLVKANHNIYFSPLQLHADFQREPLSRIDNDLMQAKMVLVDITEPRLKCLQELHLRGHFVKWVKDALEGSYIYLSY